MKGRLPYLSLHVHVDEYLCHDCLASFPSDYVASECMYVTSIQLVSPKKKMGDLLLEDVGISNHQFQKTRTVTLLPRRPDVCAADRQDACAGLHAVYFAHLNFDGEKE